MNEQATRNDCPCTGDCGRHGVCHLCIEHHRQIGTLVACMRPVAEKLYGEKKEA